MADRGSSPSRLEGLSRLTSWLPWLFPAALSAVIIVRSAAISGRKALWSDELLTWYPASASFGSMWSATHDTLSAAPPLYFVLAWVWAHLFGNGAWSLRLISSLAICAAIFAMFAVLRRVYGAIPAAAGVGIALAFGNFWISHNAAEARFHPLFLAEIALAILLYQRIMLDGSTVALLIANTAIHAAMAYTHYFAPLYSGALLLAALLNALLNASLPPRRVVSYAASAVIGWLTFLPWIPTMLVHRDMGKPTFWIPIPRPGQLLGHYTENFTDQARALFVVLLIVVVATFRRRWWRFQHATSESTAVLAVVPAIAVVPIAVFVLSTRPGAIPTFHGNYMLATVLAWSIVVAHVSTWALQFTPKVPQVLLLILALTLGGGWRTLDGAYAYVPRGYPVDPQGNEPVVVEHIHEFMALNFYSPHPTRYRYLIDPDVALSEGGGGPLGQKIMAALKRQFPQYFPGVTTTEEFLSSTRTFLVRRGDGNWFPTRIQDNPAFTASVQGPRTLRVTRVN